MGAPVGGWGGSGGALGVAARPWPGLGTGQGPRSASRRAERIARCAKGGRHLGDRGVPSTRADPSGSENTIRNRILVLIARSIGAMGKRISPTPAPRSPAPHPPTPSCITAPAKCARSGQHSWNGWFVSWYWGTGSRTPASCPPSWPPTAPSCPPAACWASSCPHHRGQRSGASPWMLPGLPPVLCPGKPDKSSWAPTYSVLHLTGCWDSFPGTRRSRRRMAIRLLTGTSGGSASGAPKR